MMSLGQSFDPLLTGRENAVTAGILAGYTRKQAFAKLDEIVEFAELREFFDLPTRTYSDGMRMRLAFSVAISVRPEILLIDEVLSVGDLRFQDKCVDSLRALQDRGCSITFASHDEDHVRRLCNRVVWLANGRIKAWGSPDEVYEQYRTAMHAETDRRIAATTVAPRHGGGLRIDENRFGTLEVEIADVRVEPISVQRSPAAGHSPVRIEIDLDPRVAVEDPIVSVSLRRDADGDMPVDVNTAADGVRLGRLERHTTVALVLDRLDLPPGTYRLDVGVYEAEWSHVYDYHWQAYPLEVRGGGSGFGPGRTWVTSRD
jgi:lipopolysaccharide transport system ATP-binding protein